MNIKTMKTRKGFTLVELLVVIAIIVALAAMATPQIFKALKRAALADALNNVRQVKFALDGFATDFDGQFPNEDTATTLGGQGGTSTSNDFFRQLFLSGETQSEKIFWVKNSPVAAGAPDDKIMTGGKLAESEILQAGNVHWAYLTDQTNVSNVARPLLMDCYKSGGTEFDPELWDRKAIVLRIDGSAKALRMSLTDNKVKDGSGNELISATADAFQGSGEDPTNKLKQPQPKGGG